MLLYLARPIDFAHGDEAANIIADIKDMARFFGFAVFDPSGAWSHGAHHNQTQKTNFEILKGCSAIISVFPSGVRTFGVPMELGAAHMLGIPACALVGTEASASVAIGQTVDVLIDISDEHFRLDLETFLKGIRERSKQRAIWEPMPDGQQPKTGKEGDAGFDLYFASDTNMTIEPGARANVPSRIGVEFPPDVWCMLLGRSSSFQRGLLVAPSVIDAGYRGELFACVWNFGGSTVTIYPEERIAQIVPMPLLADRFEWSKGIMSNSERGTTGFGSTGR